MKNDERTMTNDERLRPSVLAWGKGAKQRHTTLRSVS